MRRKDGRTVKSQQIIEPSKQTAPLILDLFVYFANFVFKVLKRFGEENRSWKGHGRLAWVVIYKMLFRGQQSKQLLKFFDFSSSSV